MKKVIIIVISLAVIIGVVYAVSYTASHTEGNIVQLTDPENEPAAVEAKADTLKEKYDITKPLTVPDDDTGNWRMITISSSATPQDYIKDFYDTYYESDKIFIIFNLGLNTTTTIKQLAGDIIAVDVYEYVKGEEVSAKSMIQGEHLQSFSYDPSTDTFEDLGV